MDFAKTLEKVHDFCERENLQFSLVGGLGLQAYGLSRATFDLDLAFSTSAQPGIIRFLEGMGYETLHRSTGFSNHVHTDPALGRVDVIYVDDATARRLFEKPSTQWKLGTLAISVPRAEYLAAMKVHAMKNDPTRTFKELADIQFLMSLPGFDEEELKGYFSRAGLLERFNELKKTR